MTPQVTVSLSLSYTDRLTPTNKTSSHHLRHLREGFTIPGNGVKKIRTSLSLSLSLNAFIQSCSASKGNMFQLFDQKFLHKFQEAEIIVSQNMPQNPLNPESDNHHYYSFISSKHLRMGRSNSHWDCLIKPSIS